MTAWERLHRWVRALPFFSGSSTPMTDWNLVLQNIADIRVWLAEIEQRIRSEHNAPARVAPPATTSVDEDVAAADSVTRVHKALEREFGVDRRTVYQRVERLVEAYQLHRNVPDWKSNVAFHKKLAERDASGKTRLERGLATLDAKREVAA